MRLFIAVLALGAIAHAQNPCVGFTELDSKERNSKWVLAGPALCDELLPQGWYRFRRDAGLHMAEGKVAPNMCGTRAPIYLAGKHPAKGNHAETDVKICANFGQTANGCAWSDTIKVKRCPDPAGDFFVYLLKPTPACDMAYCGYSAQICPDGQVLDDTGTMCIAKTPSVVHPEVGLPVVTGDDFHIPCKFTVTKAADTAKGMADVVFLFNGKIGYTASGVSLTKGFAPLPGRELKGKMPSTVTCALIGYWKHMKGDNFARTPLLRSKNNFFAGIRVLTEKGQEVKGEFIFGEDDTKPQKIRLEATVPITKNTHEPLLKGVTPRLDIGVLTHVSGGQLLKRGPHRCTAEIQVGDWNSKVAASKDTLDFVAYRDQTAGAGAAGNTIELEIRKQLTKFSIWENYDFPDIKVKVKKSSPTTCLTNPDPHFKSFDGRRFDVHALGEFKLAEIPGQFEATTRHWPCPVNPKPACNCGFSFRELDEIILIDMCNNQPTPMIIYRNAKDPTQVIPKDLKIFGDAAGKSFEISARSGIKAVITTDKRYGLSIALSVPEGYNNELVGLCGNNNKNPTDDFFLKSHRSFYESFRVRQPTASPFQLQHVPALMKNKRTLNADNFCFCYQKVVRCDQTPTRDPRSLRFNNPVMTRLAQRLIAGRRRRAAGQQLPYTDDVIAPQPYNFDLNPPDRPIGTLTFPTPSGITEARAKEACEKAMRNSTIGSMCAMLPNFDIFERLGDCLFDIKVTDSLSVASMTVGAMENECSFKAQTISPEDRPKLSFNPDLIEKERCPESCSGRGSCNKGVCTCSTGFAGADCSVNTNALPKLHNFLDAGICDVTERPCKRTAISVEDIYSSSKLSCRHVITAINPLTGKATGTKSVVVKATMDTYASVICPLPQLEGGAMKLMTSVSNDGVRYGKELAYFIQDSTCVSCDSGNCVMEGDACFIDNKCVSEGETNKVNSRQSCQPKKSQSAWTAVPAVCGSATISSTSNTAVSLGSTSKTDTWPWHAMVMADDKHVCSAVLVQKRWLLTSSDCITNRVARKALTVHLGSGKYTVASSQTSGALTLLRLSSDVNDTPLCLPSKPLDATATNECYATGFANSIDDCYDPASKGADYRGIISITKNNNFCFSWAASSNYPVTIQRFAGEGVGQHSQCRNPGSERAQPWCYVDMQGTMEDCAVPKCEASITDKLHQTRAQPLNAAVCKELYAGTLKSNQICAGFSGLKTFKGELGGPLVCRTNSGFQLLGLRSPFTSVWSSRAPPAYDTLNAKDLAWIKQTTQS